MVMPQMTQFQVKQPPYHKKIEEVKLPVLPEPPVEEEELTLPDVFFKVYPDRRLGDTEEEIEGNINAFVYDDTEGFIRDLQAKGRNPDTENLLKYLNVPDETINAIFTTGEGGEPVIPEGMMAEVQGVRKFVKIDPETLVARDLVGRTIGKYDPQTGRVTEQLGPPVSFAQPEKGWLDKVQELADDPAKLIPFVSSGVEIVELSKLMKTALDLEQKKEVSKEDLLALKAYVDRATMNTTWGYEVMDVIGQLLPFAGELLATAGIFSIGKTAVVKAGQTALKKIATRTGLRILESKLAQYGLEVAGVVAGGTLQTLPAGATRIPAATLEKQLQATLTGDEESVWRSLAKATGEAWVETVSERTGGLFTPLTSKVKGGLVKLGLFKAFQKANPGKSPDALKKIMERMGYNGVLNEMLEERIGDVAHGVLAELGLSDQKFQIPSLRQLSVELVSFSIPGVASKAVETMPKIAPGIRGALGEARAAPEAGFIRPGAEPRGEKPGEVTPAPVVTKQPYQMTKAEFSRKSLRDAFPTGSAEGKPFEELTDQQAIATADAYFLKPTGVHDHEYFVKQAISEGKPVPPEVLKDYPDLAKQVTPPVTEAGMPPSTSVQTGLPGMGVTKAQAKMFEEVSGKEAGKVPLTQVPTRAEVSEQQQRFTEAQEEAVTAPEEVKEAYEAQAEIEGIKVTLETDPVANLRFKVGNRNYAITDLVDAKEKTFAYNDSFTPSQAKAIKPYATFSEANKLPNGRIRADAVLDDLATKYTGGDVNAFIEKVNQLREQKAQLRKLQTRVVGVEEGLPYLSVPEATKLPMPDRVTVSEDRVVMPPPPPAEPPPPEPPATHPSQPAPMEAGKITMPDLQAPQTVVDIYSKPDFWRRVGNLPLVRKAVGLFNPAAVANNPAQQAIILRAALKDEGAQKAQAVISYLWEIGTQERIWGKTDEMGLLTSEPFGALPIDEIRTNPKKYEHLMTDKQKEWIKRANEIERVKLEALRRNDIEINELSFEDGGEYAGRRVMGKFNDSGELIESGQIRVGGRVGAKQAFEKTRVFKDAFDGIAAGYRYMNTDEALYYNILGAYNKIADRQMSDWLLSKVDWRTTKAPEELVLQAEAAHIRLRKAEQLLGALNRAVRGERVPDATINSIANVYADQADTLKTLIPQLQKKSPQTADTVRILDAEAKALIADAKLEYAEAVNKRARAREEALRVKYEEASIAHPAFAGKIFTGAEAKEIADILNKGLNPQFIEAIGAVNKVNAIGRFFMLAGDVSPMTIQLQFLAFFRPKAYAKAMGGFVRAMFDPEFQYRYYAQNRDLINRHPTLILSGRGTEFTEFMGRGGLGKKLGILAKPLVPFQKAFEGCIDVAGIELAKSLDHRATTPQATHDIDQFINEFRGLTSSARIGVSTMQRQVETSVLLAPRYNRAIAAYLFDIVHGGLRGELARMSLGQGMAGLAAMAVALSIALGEDEDEIWEHFDPTSNKFFTWDVMGVKIGLGGKVRSLLKTFGNMLRTGEVGQPALNFLRGNLSPAISTSLDLLTGKNYIGEPTRDNVLNFSKTVGRNFMMIWTQNLLLEGGTLKDKALIATAEFLGLRGYDISAKKEFKIKELDERLGEVVGKTPVLTKKPTDIYDTRNIFNDVKQTLQYIPPEDILADKGYEGWGHFVTKIMQSEANNMPNIAFKDYNFDKTKGDIFPDYVQQWAERQKIIEDGERAVYTRVKVVEGKEERTTFKGMAALVAHRVDYPNAQRGNLSRREKELLLEYNATADKKQFEKDHPEIKVNKYTDWMKSHARENAEFALVGQVDILSKEAYNQYQKLIKELDIPDAALLKNVLPPETSLDTHFRRLELVAEGREGQAEANLALLLDDKTAKEKGVESYVDWRNRTNQPLKLPDETIEYYQTVVDNQELFDKKKAIDEDETLDDKIKGEDGLTDKQRAMAELRATKVGDETFHDIERRVDAMGKGTRDNPTPPEIVDAHVGYSRIVDQTDTYAEGAEAKLFLIDNESYRIARYDKNIWGSDVLTEELDMTQVQKWRLQVKYRDKFTEYDTTVSKKYEDMPDANVVAVTAPEGINPDWWAKQDVKTKRDFLISLDRDAMLEADPAFRLDRLRVKAYQDKIPEVEDYVAFNELPLAGDRRYRFIIEHGGQDPNNPTGFAHSYKFIMNNDLPDPTKVTSVEYDDLYDNYKTQFGQIEAFKNIKSDQWKDDTFKDPITGRTDREQAVYDLRHNPDGSFSEFGHAEIMRNGYYELKGAEQYVDEWVEYYTTPAKGYAQERYLKEHQDFYKVMKATLGWTETIKWDWIPSEKVENLWNQYQNLPKGKRREDFRYLHLDLDAWLVTTGKVSKSIEETYRERALTPAERFIEELEKSRKEFEESLK